MKTIVIIGAGWYGCHIAKILQHKYRIIIIEKNSDIFSGSSYYNQNRLHLGYHYCRDFGTRSLCKNNYERFKTIYNECIDDINDNYYVIADKSIIDYNTYLSIYKYEGFDFEILPNTTFKNIQGNVLNVGEKVVNSQKVKDMFIRDLTNVEFVFNTTVTNVENFGNKVIVNGNYECDFLFDCTYNQLNLDTDKYIYELTISLVYEKIGLFGSLTVMDGHFCSLYPKSDNKYTLTDVEYTPIKVSTSFDEVNNYEPTEEEINMRRIKMEEKMIGFYPEFLKNFVFDSYFLSFKTKMISGSDSRNITIKRISKRIVTVNCGKIYGIFDWEDYITNYLDTINTDEIS